MRSMALRLPMCRADRSHSSAVIMKYAPPPPSTPLLPSSPSVPPTVYSRRGRKLGPALLKMLREHLAGIHFIWAHLSSLRKYPKIIMFFKDFIYCFFSFFLCLVLLFCVALLNEVQQGDTATHLLFPCCHRFYARDNMRNKPCHTSQGPPFIRAVAIWKLLLSQTTVFVKCDRENQALCK